MTTFCDGGCHKKTAFINTPYGRFCGDCFNKRQSARQEKNLEKISVTKPKNVRPTFAMPKTEEIVSSIAHEVFRQRQALVHKDTRDYMLTERAGIYG